MNRGLAYDAALDTYLVAPAPFNLAAAATDFFVVVGSPTRTVMILEYYLSLSISSPGGVSVLGIKRSSDNTGGTFTLPTIVPADSSNLPSGAVARAYTVNPAALGNLVGNVGSFQVQASTGFSAYTSCYQRQFGEQPITLRGINEVFALNLIGQTIAGQAVKTLLIRWVEL